MSKKRTTPPLAIKKPLLFLLGVVLFFVIALPFERAADFARHSRAAAGALFLDEKDSRRFICSGTVIGHTSDGTAEFLTARHCVWQDASNGDMFNPPNDAGLLGKQEVSFADNEGGPFYQATPWKISTTDDLAILLLTNGGNLPAVRLGTEQVVGVGAALTNYSFAMSMGKLDIAIRSVAPVFAHGADSFAPEYRWDYSMPVDGTIAPGSSGSGLFDPRQQALIGVVVGASGHGGLCVAEPVSRVWNLLADTKSEPIK